MNIRVAPSGATSRAGKRRRNRLPVFVGLGFLLAMAAGVFLLIRLGDSTPDENSEQKASPRAAGTSPASADLNETESSESEKVAEELAVEDDGKLLWVSPTAGSPISLRYVPLGTQLLLHIRPADLLAHTEGSKIRAAMGPWGEQAIAKVEEFTGAQLDEIATLLICLQAEESGGLGYTLRCEMLESWDDRRLAERLAEASSAMQGEQSYFVTKRRACFLPLGDQSNTLVSCPLTSVVELIESEADAPPLARDIERLLQLSDRRRDITLVFPTKFLQTSGNNLLRGTAENLHWALQELVADDAAVVAWSAHWEEDFFLELQSTITFNHRPHTFAKAVRRRMEEVPDMLVERVRDQPVHPYGKNVIERFPEMLQQVSLATRSGEERGISVMRCYLPLPAGHNLLMATELALNIQTTASPIQTAASRGVPAPGTQPTTVAAKLKKITSLSFTKETFERALEILSEDIGVAIKLRGSDLQLEGITKNQSFEIDLEDRPAGEILLGVLLRANPDRSATGPADPKQKLVYVVRETVGDQPGVIVVTTRTAVTKRGIQLPAVFEPASR